LKTRNELLLQLANDAGACLLSYFGQPLNEKLKADTSTVTDADLASDKIIVSGIRAAFPNDRILSEESAKDEKPRGKPGEYLWIIDPLDGTSNFAHSLPYYAVSIGLVGFSEDGQPDYLAGAVNAPSMRYLFHATKGQGSFCNGERILLQPKQLPFSRRFLVTGFYYQQGEMLKHDLALFSRVAEQCQTIRRMGAAALDLCFVANGVFDAFWERGLSPWDVAAGVLIVREAGRVVTNYDGAAFDMTKSGLIAGDSEVVDTILKLI
jgi:myo-inositol-1(or 4)-monophosphatase